MTASTERMTQGCTQPQRDDSRRSSSLAFLSRGIARGDEDDFDLIEPEIAE